MNYIKLHLKKILLLTTAFACIAITPAARAQEDGAAPSVAAVEPAAVAQPEAARADFNLFEILAARGIQSSLQGKDLTVAWRVLRITASESETLMRVLAILDAPTRTQTPWSDVYYTRGDVISVASQSYLVTYQVQPSYAVENKLVSNWLAEGAPQTLESVPPLEEDTNLALSLVAIDKTTSLNNFRAFNPAKDLLTAESKAQRLTQTQRATSRSNLKQIGLGLLQYVQDYDEKLPPMRAAKTSAEFIDTPNNSPISEAAPVQFMLHPYVKHLQIFVQPETGRPYLPNYKISRRNLSEFTNPTAVVTFFEDAPDAENKRNVAFLDGHVETLDEADWQTLRVAQKISESGFPPTAPTASTPPPKAPKAQNTAPPATKRLPGSTSKSPVPEPE